MELILGSAQLVRNYGVVPKSGGGKRIDRPSQIINRSRQLGFTAIDTAPAYGRAEEEIGSTRTNQLIHTKLRPGTDFENSLRCSLKALQRRKVELLYIHDTALLADLNSSIRASLVSLRAHGAEFLGASIYDLADLDYVLAAGVFDVVQLPLNVFDSRFTPEVIHLTQNEGFKVYARSIFLQGVLLSRPADLPPAVSALAPYVERFRNTCAEWGAEPIDALARFIVERRDVDGLVIGVSSLRELERLSQALSASVAPGLLDSIEALEKPPWVLADPRNWS